MRGSWLLVLACVLIVGAEEALARRRRPDRNRSRPEPEERVLNPSEQFNRMLNYYDVRVRPNYGSTAIPVSVSVVVQSALPEKSGLVSVDMDLTMEWEDVRLVYDNSSLVKFHLTKNQDILWVPILTPTNMEKGGVTEASHWLIGAGLQKHFSRMQGHFRCPRLRHDSSWQTGQTITCLMTFRSYTYTSADLILTVPENQAAVVHDGINVDGLSHKVKSAAASTQRATLPSGSFDVITVTMTLEAN